MAFFREDLDNHRRWKEPKVWNLHCVAHPGEGRSCVLISVHGKIDGAALIGTFELYHPESAGCRAELQEKTALRVKKIFGVMMVEEWSPSQAMGRSRLVYSGKGWVYCDKKECDLSFTIDESESWRKVVTLSVIHRRTKSMIFQVKIELKVNEKEGKIIPS